MRSLTAITLASFVLSACGGGNPEGESTQQDSTAMGNATNVTTLTLEPVDFAHYFNVQGVVEAEQNAQLFPEAAARVVTIQVKEGDRVEKGQTLITLDSRVIASSIDEARAGLGLAETLYKKQQALWDQKIGSEVQYLQAKNNYEAAKERMETLQAQQAMYTLKAPFSGIVDEIIPKEGEMANPAMPVIRLINMDQVYIKADVTEGYLGKLNAGDSVEVSLPSMDATHTSTITRLGNYINPDNRTFKIRIEMRNKNLELKPNLLADLKIKDYSNDSSIVVPSALVQMTPTGEEFVFVIDNSGGTSTAKKVMIETGMSYENKTEVLGGLSAGDVLIDKGARSIKEGDLVSVAE